MTSSNASNETTTSSGKKMWIELINESVHTSDDVDIGDIDAVSRDFVVIKRGFVNVHYYYIPIDKVEGWDNNVLWLKIKEEEVKRKYERDIAPSPSRYYVKDHPVYRTAYYPPLITIPSRYVGHSYDVASSGDDISPDKIIPSEVPRVYRCDLCKESNLKSEDELTEHVRANH
jgi:hypothetical protein